MVRTYWLRDMYTWVELKPLDDDVAEVVCSNVYSRGDRVAKPDCYTWEEAAFSGCMRDSVLRPVELELVYDSFTGETRIPQCRRRRRRGRRASAPRNGTPGEAAKELQKQDTRRRRKPREAA